MLTARIFASVPRAARYSARILHEAGYEVEIVPPGTQRRDSVDLEFDADNDKVISQNEKAFVSGEREFVLKPLWRKMTARRKTEQDIADAKQLFRAYASKRAAERVPAVAAVPAVSQAVPVEPSASEQWAQEAARVAADQEAERQRAVQAQRAEEVRLQLVREENEAAKRRELELQRAELQRQEVAREAELARRAEIARQRLALRKQQEEQRHAEELRLGLAAENAHQLELAQEQEEVLRQESFRTQSAEAHRRELLDQRQTEDIARRAEAQRLLIEAHKQRAESVRRRSDVVVPAAASSVPSFREYMRLRRDQSRRARADETKRRANVKVTNIDSSGSFAWRQAWPVTAGVAAAFLIGWGIAAYHAPAAKVAAQPPQMLQPGQVAPYPVATLHNTAKKPVAARRSTVRDTRIADDEVIVHRYTQPSAVTAQNRSPQHPRKISDLQ